MTTDIDYTKSTAGNVLRGLREPPGDGPDDGSDAEIQEARSDGQQVETVEQNSPEAGTGSGYDSRKKMTAARRFTEVNWTGEERVETEQTSPAAAPSDPVGRMRQTAAERFQAVAWDPSQAKRRSDAERERQQAIAEKRSERMKLKNFFGGAKF